MEEDQDITEELEEAGTTQTTNGKSVIIPWYYTNSIKKLADALEGEVGCTRQQLSDMFARSPEHPHLVDSKGKHWYNPATVAFWISANHMGLIGKGSPLTKHRLDRYQRKDKATTTDDNVGLRRGQLARARREEILLKKDLSIYAVKEKMQEDEVKRLMFLKAQLQGLPMELAGKVYGKEIPVIERTIKAAHDKVFLDTQLAIKEASAAAPDAPIEIDDIDTFTEELQRLGLEDGTNTKL